MNKTNNSPSDGIDSEQSQAADNSLSRKEMKKLEAEFRQSVAPLKKVIQQGEKAMEKHQRRLTEIEEILADTSLYESHNKETLKEYLAEQAEVTGLIEDCEMSWLEAQEALEQAENEFKATVGA